MEVTFPHDLFDEPEEFRPPEPLPTAHIFTRKNCVIEGDTPVNVEYRLVGRHSLWAHVACEYFFR